MMDVGSLHGQYIEPFAVREGTSNEDGIALIHYPASVRVKVCHMISSFVEHKNGNKLDM